ncbi:heme ABC transporter permease [Candidatus Berkiella aquae]|uniref:heme ABC transporter permease n=1 Tax=Candidatus Berkiella aquae TaxID=295108 RepID=UPI0040554AB5
MIQYLTSLGTPRRFYQFCGVMQPWLFISSILALAYGLVAGLFIAPADYLQGEGFRIIYVHVPCAMLSMLLYVVLALSGVVYLIWRIKVADLIAYCIAPIGALFTFCALVTGAIWGKPMWGTWWIWDARLTSELILLFLYIGYIGLYSAINNPKSAAKISAIFALIGLIDIPIIHYSVYWWNTLHQGATITRLAKPSIDSSMLWPLLSMIAGMALYTAAIMCLKLRTQILTRESQSRWVQLLVSNKA